MRILAVNTLRTGSEISEQNGLPNLIKGLFGTFRSPTEISWNMTEADALDLLTMASFIHAASTAQHKPRELFQTDTL
jgi:hypothetical protein